MKVRNGGFGSTSVIELLPSLVPVLIGALFSAPQLAPAGESAAPAEEQVFTLHEASVFKQGGQEFISGQAAECRDLPYSEVKAYPKFVTTKPIYGVVRFESDYRRADSGIAYYFAVDESRGTGKGYDRLYFDINRDLDLQNDTVARPLRNPPPEASLRYDGIKEQVLFDYLAPKFDLANGEKRPVEILPRLLRTTYEQETYNQVSFVRTHLYTGLVKIGAREFDAQLGNKYVVQGRLDHPTTSLVLKSREGGSSPSWWGADSLSAVHKVDGAFYVFSANPAGDKLTVRRYSGDLGVFEVGPGARSLDKLSLRGALRGADLAVAAGGEMVDGWPKEARSCLVPAGDFLPAYLNVELGSLKIFLSENYHSDGKPRDRGGRPPVYGITIRKDKPFVLDFTTKPEVVFASPARNQRLKLGDMLEVKAVLVDPKLDIMIRGLDDNSKKLDPTVIVRRSNGDKVTEGPMPFG